MTAPSERLRAEAEAYATSVLADRASAAHRDHKDDWLAGAHSRDSEIAALVAALERVTCDHEFEQVREALAAHRERGEKE